MSFWTFWTQALIDQHPLQRFSSPSRGFSALIHLSGLTSFFITFAYLFKFPNPINESYGWHFQYLTIIGLALAMITFTFGLLADITLSPRLFLIKNTLSMMSAPLAILVSLLYWGISAIDKKLVLADWAPALGPLVDFGFHAAPALYLFFDLMFLSPPWTITILPAASLSMGLAGLYWLWVEQCYKYNGWYPYPLFEHLSTPYRAMVFAGSALLMTASTATLIWLYGRVNGLGDGRAPKARPGAVKRS